MPGLSACLGCGQDLSRSPADLQILTVPRVATANPLKAPPRPRPAPADRARWDQGVVLARGILWACLWGVLPGLGPLVRGDRRTAAILAGAFLACGLAWGLLWHSALQPLAWMAALSVIASASATEARARHPGRGPLWNAATLGFAMAMALSVHVVAAFAYDTWLPRVVLGDTPRLSAGHFVVERVGPGDLQVDDLVAVGQRPAFWRILDEPVLVGPVLALEGQRVESDGEGLRVDGEPAAVHAMNPGVRAPGLPEGGVVVPPGQVAVLVAPIRFVEPGELLGRLHYRWLPQEDRGPLQWPPSESP